MKVITKTYLLPGLIACFGLLVFPRTATCATFILHASHFWDCTQGCSLDFDIGTHVASVTGAWISASGYQQEGEEARCEDDYHVWYVHCPPLFVASIARWAVHPWYGIPDIAGVERIVGGSQSSFEVNDIPVEHGHFLIYHYQFEPMTDEDWGFLSDGTGRLDVWTDCDSYTGPFCNYCNCQNFILRFDDITLVIEYEVGVPAGNPTWGNLKAHYR